MGNPIRLHWVGWSPKVKQVVRLGRSLGILSSCEGVGIHRIGARAFSTLEGYASRNRETELAFPRCAGKRTATVPVLV
jgi:hypothetical protein